MREYEIWIEGYQVIGMKDPQRAHLLGKMKANNFWDACYRLIIETKGSLKNLRQGTFCPKYFNRGLYDNAAEARLFLG